MFGVLGGVDVDQLEVSITADNSFPVLIHLQPIF